MRALLTSAGAGLCCVLGIAATFLPWADRAVLATNVFPSLIVRNRLQTVPVYDYVLATEPLTDAQLAWPRL